MFKLKYKKTAKDNQFCTDMIASAGPQRQRHLLVSGFTNTKSVCVSLLC